MVSDNIELISPNFYDIEYICNNLRKIDILEISDTGKDARQSLRRAFECGEVVCVAKANEKPFAAFCVAKNADGSSLITQKRYCWLSATDFIKDVGVGALRKALYNIDDVVQTFGHIYSYCRDDNPCANRFLRALGFKTTGEKVLFNGKEATYYERIF